MSTAERWYRFKELPADIEQRLGRLVPLLEQEGVLLAYLFGSLARGSMAQDVDLALLMPEETPAFRLRQAITDCLGSQRLDLVDLRRASPRLRFEIISTGRSLYAADEEQRLQYELATLRLYHDTAYLRRKQGELLRRRMAQWSSDARALKSD